jgi:hypothetical protein
MRHDLLITMTCMGLGVYDIICSLVRGEEVKSHISWERDDQSNPILYRTG